MMNLKTLNTFLTILVQFFLGVRANQSKEYFTYRVKKKKKKINALNTQHWVSELQGTIKSWFSCLPLDLSCYGTLHFLISPWILRTVGIFGFKQIKAHLNLLHLVFSWWKSREHDILKPNVMDFDNVMKMCIQSPPPPQRKKVLQQEWGWTSILAFLIPFFL